MAGLRTLFGYFMSNTAQQLLHDVFGYSSFRGEQEAIVAHVSAGGDALVLMPTGTGFYYILQSVDIYVK